MKTVHPCFSTTADKACVGICQSCVVSRQDAVLSRGAEKVPVLVRQAASSASC